MFQELNLSGLGFSLYFDVFFHNYLQNFYMMYFISVATNRICFLFFGIQAMFIINLTLTYLNYPTTVAWFYYFLVFQAVNETLYFCLCPKPSLLLQPMHDTLEIKRASKIWVEGI